MNIYLYDTLYLKCVKETESLNNERKIFSCAKESLQFHYGTVTYAQFSLQATSEGWIQRKIVALPFAAIELAKTIYFLAQGILTTLFHGWDASRPCFFHATRAFQGCGGALLVIFHNTWGLFNIQESIFQRDCYNLHSDSVSFLDFALQGNQQEIIQLLTVSDMKNCDANRLTIVQGHLTSTDPEINTAEYPDAGNIPLTKLHLLQADYIAEHIAEFPSPVCQLFTDEQIQQIELSNLSAPQINVLFSRLSTFKAFSVDDIAEALTKGLLDNIPLDFLTQEHLVTATLDNLSAVTLKKIFECEEPLVKFNYFDEDSVQRALLSGKLSDAQLCDLVSDEQLEGLDISRLSFATTKQLFTNSERFPSRRFNFANLSSDEVASLLRSGYLNNTPLNSLTRWQLLQAPLNEILYSETLKKIFECPEHFDKFTVFQKDHVQDALYYRKTLQNAEVLDLISDEQLKGLEISRLDKTTIELIFASTTPRSPKTWEDSIRRFELIDPDERYSAMRKGLLKDISIDLWRPKSLENQTNEPLEEVLLEEEVLSDISSDTSGEDSSDEEP